MLYLKQEEHKTRCKISRAEGTEIIRAVVARLMNLSSINTSSSNRCGDKDEIDQPIHIFCRADRSGRGVKKDAMSFDDRATRESAFSD